MAETKDSIAADIPKPVASDSNTTYQQDYSWKLPMAPPPQRLKPERKKSEYQREFAWPPNSPASSPLPTTPEPQKTPDKIVIPEPTRSNAVYEKTPDFKSLDDIPTSSTRLLNATKHNGSFVVEPEILTDSLRNDKWANSLRNDSFQEFRLGGKTKKIVALEANRLSKKSRSRSMFSLHDHLKVLETAVDLSNPLESEYNREFVNWTEYGKFSREDGSFNARSKQPTLRRRGSWSAPLPGPLRWLDGQDKLQPTITDSQSIRASTKQPPPRPKTSAGFRDYFDYDNLDYTFESRPSRADLEAFSATRLDRKYNPSPLMSTGDIDDRRDAGYDSRSRERDLNDRRLDCDGIPIDKYDDRRYDDRRGDRYDDRRSERYDDRRYEDRKSERYEDRRHDYEYERGDRHGRPHDREYDDKYERSREKGYDDRYGRPHDREYDDRYERPHDREYDDRYERSREQGYDSRYERSRYDDRYERHREKGYDDRYERSHDKEYERSREKGYDDRYERPRGKDYDDRRTDAYDTRRYGRVDYRPEAAHGDRRNERDYDDRYSGKPYDNNRREIPQDDHRRDRDSKRDHRNDSGYEDARNDRAYETRSSAQPLDDGRYADRAYSKGSSPSQVRNLTGGPRDGIAHPASHMRTRSNQSSLSSASTPSSPPTPNGYETFEPRTKRPTEYKEQLYSSANQTPLRKGFSIGDDDEPIDIPSRTSRRHYPADSSLYRDSTAPRGRLGKSPASSIPQSFASSPARSPSPPGDYRRYHHHNMVSPNLSPTYSSRPPSRATSVSSHATSIEEESAVLTDMLRIADTATLRSLTDQLSTFRTSRDLTRNTIQGAKGTAKSTKSTKSTNSKSTKASPATKVNRSSLPASTKKPSSIRSGAATPRTSSSAAGSRKSSVVSGSATRPTSAPVKRSHKPPSSAASSISSIGSTRSFGPGSKTSFTEAREALSRARMKVEEMLELVNNGGFEV